jgi:hypothetical protein
MGEAPSYPKCMTRISATEFRCEKHGFVLRNPQLPIRCQCPDISAQPIPVTPLIPEKERKKGPGDYLHETIKHWTGEDIERGCQCKAWIDRMNAWGPAGCREHLNEIVAHMLSEAKKRGWKLAGLPGAATVAGLAVRRACRMAEKAEAARAN